MLLITDRTETPGYTVGKYSDQRTYTVRLVCDPGYSDKRLTRLVSALRGEARADAGHTEDQSRTLPDFRTRPLVG